jgi:hypothetical protein
LAEVHPNKQITRPRTTLRLKLSAMAAAATAVSSLVSSCSFLALSSSSSYSQRNAFVGGADFGVKRISVSGWGRVRAGEVAEAETETVTKPVPRLKRIYLEKVVPALKEEFKYKNEMEVSGRNSAMATLYQGCHIFNNFSCLSGRRKVLIYNGHGDANMRLQCLLLLIISISRFSREFPYVLWKR